MKNLNKKFKVTDKVNTKYGTGIITYINEVDKTAKVKINSTPITDFYLKELEKIK